MMQLHWMDFRPNKTPIKVIKKGAFGGFYIRDIYFGVTDKWHKNSWKYFSVRKDIDQNIIVQIILMLVLINMMLSVEHH